MTIVESVLYILETGRSAVVDARDPGYPIIPVMNFAVGGNLRSVVLFEYLS
jgi:hypothetical protein